MKKLALTTVIILVLGLGGFAQSFFQKESAEFDGGNRQDQNQNNPMLALPSEHGLTNDTGAPLGSGIAMLMGLGAAYLVAKRRNEE